MKHTVEHGLSREQAKKATEKAFDAYKERFAKYNPDSSWVSDNEAKVSFSAKGVTLEGTVILHDEDIELEMDVPFLLKPFKSKAVSVIEDEITKWVEKAKQGELD